jgi:hypothetical protein
MVGTLTPHVSFEFETIVEEIPMKTFIKQLGQTIVAVLTGVALLAKDNIDFLTGAPGGTSRRTIR